MDTVRVGIIGTQFIATIHADSIKRYVNGAELIAAASPTEDHVKKFTADFSIPHAYTDYREMLERNDIDLIIVGAPNDLHCQMVCDAADAGKHVIIEKPFCVNLAQADEMIEACKWNHVKLMYAEELCFTPKYVRLKTIVG